MGAIYTVFGIISVLSGIISTLLNPISFYYHFIKRSTTSARLYCLLAAADFATNLILPFFLTYRFLSDRPQENIGFRNISTTERVMSALFYCPSYISGYIVSTIAIVRCIAVRFPFYTLRERPLFSFLLAVFLFYFAASLLEAFSDDLFWCPLQEYAFAIISSTSTHSSTLELATVIGIISYMGVTIIGSAASIGTILLVLIRKIKRNSLTQNTAPTNSTEILRDGIRISSMIVFANVINPAFQIVSTIRNDGCVNDSTLGTMICIFTYSVCNIISSALDPLIVIIFSRELKQVLKDKIFGK